MVSLVFRATALVFGFVLVLLGIVGLFLPFLQGILLILLGLSVMSLVSERAAAVLQRVRARVEGFFERRGWGVSVPGGLGGTNDGNPADGATTANEADQGPPSEADPEHGAAARDNEGS